MPESIRKKIYSIAEKNYVQILILESLPQFISYEILEEIRFHMPNVKLIVGMGFQSLSKEIRELCINSPVKLDDFLKANEMLSEFKYFGKAYVMLKPPFLTEKEAILEAVSTVAWLNENNVKDIALCPTRIAEGTVAYDMYKKGLYTPPLLDSIIATLIRIQSKGYNVRVSLSNVDSADFESITAISCDKCRKSIYNALLLYNENFTGINLEELRCIKCSSDIKKREQGDFFKKSIIERVKQYIKLYESQFSSVINN
jgi:radical SAM enzyme (TIGR01210 family)